MARFGFNSYQRLTIKRGGLIWFGFAIQRPPFAPIVRAQLTATHLPPRETLDLHTPFRRHITMVLVIGIQQPLPYSHWRYLQESSQGALTPTDFYSATQGRKVGGFHGLR